MLGAISGDIIGSYYEFFSVKNKDFEMFVPKSRFTDDTVLTVALAESILTQKSYTSTLHKYFDNYQQAGYGASFLKWCLAKKTEPYNSLANGSAMRVSPVAWANETIEDVIKAAEKSSEVTHNHPEGIEGAVATAVAIFMARNGSSKKEIRDKVEELTNYDLNRKVDDIRKIYKFELFASKSVPEAIICFLESENFEDTIRNAISLGGDADTQACIAGSIAEAFYGGVPKEIAVKSLTYLDENLLSLTKQFIQRYIVQDIPLYNELF